MTQARKLALFKKSPDVLAVLTRPVSSGRTNLSSNLKKTTSIAETQGLKYCALYQFQVELHESNCMLGGAANYEKF
mgnify:CR=1 FL=1